MAKMTDQDLGVLVDNEIRQAIGYGGGKLAEQRRKAEYYFLGLAKEDLAPPDIAGRSSVIVPVVRNTIESMLPQLMVKFTGGDAVVEFQPTRQEDEQAAKNCTDYLNYLFFKKNSGHSVTYGWFKDALKLKRGIIKVWWDTRDEETREEYAGQTPVNLSMLADDPEVEIIEQKSYPDEDDARERQKGMEQLQQQLDHALNDPSPQAGQMVQQLQQRMQEIQAMPPAMLFDVVCKRKKTGGKLCVENVPPEEFLISRKAKNIQDAPFVGHKVLRTISELRSMGYENVDDLASDAQLTNAERIERLTYDDDYVDIEDRATDPSQRRVWLTEGYMRVDFDGDGVAELRKVCRAGSRTLSNEVVDVVPFVSICPIPEPHKFFGLSVADLALDGQLAETGLLRAVMDNQFLEVNGRYFAVEGQVNLDDLLTSRPGGVVRMKAPNMAGRLDQGKGNLAEAMAMMEYMKGFNEDSTGWSRMSAGTDPQGLRQTATASQIVTNKADMRVDLIARNFAEGFVELFRLMLKLVCQYQKKRASIKLSGQWVDMDPREWQNQFDVEINVGLGVGNKDQQVAHLMTLMQAQMQVAPMGIVGPPQVYAASLELAKNMGFKSGDKFFAQPDPNKPPPDPMQGQMQIEQMKAQTQAQTEQQKAQMNMQLERERLQQQAQIEQMRAQMQSEVDRSRQQVEAQKHAMQVQQDAQLAAMKAKFEEEAHLRDMQFQQWKATLDQQTSLMIARIGAESKIDAAQVTAAATLSTEQEQASDTAVGDSE